MRFSPSELAWLSDSADFPSRFIDDLAALRFTGDVDAIPEGTVFFPEEPVLRVTAPLPQAQLVESRLLNLIHFQTIIASKAARMVLAAPGRLPCEFPPLVSGIGDDRLDVGECKSQSAEPSIASFLSRSFSLIARP
jgi:nicotinate phosphoribosyltransferase